MKTQVFPMLKHVLLFLVLLGFTSPVHALWPFSKSEEELQAEAADRVARLLREPKNTIAKAQMAIEDNDLEEAIKLYREAIKQFEAIEQTEDTSGAVFSDLRFKKFHCISMLDALILKRSEVMDVRRAISDTSELEARLAQEREALKQAEKKEKGENNTPKATLPKAHQSLLSEEEQALNEAQQALQQAKHELTLATTAYEENDDAFTDAAKRHAAADANLLNAHRHYTKIQQNEDASDRDIGYAKTNYEKATANAQKAKAELETIRTQLDNSEAALIQAEAQHQQALEAVKSAQQRVAVRKQLLEKEAEKQRIAEIQEKQKKEEEQKAAILLQKQKEAEENARLAKAIEAERLQKDKVAREAAIKDRQRLALELDLCNDLWNDKDIDALERRLMKNCELWPNEHTFLVHLARLRLLQGRIDDALDVSELIPSTGKTGLQARLVAAAAYLKKNQPEDAKTVLEQAMKDMPEAPEPYFNMAITLLRLPKFDPNRDISAEYYIRSVELGGKRSLLLERRLNMKEKSNK